MWFIYELSSIVLTADVTLESTLYVHLKVQNLALEDCKLLWRVQNIQRQEQEFQLYIFITNKSYALCIFC